MCRRISSASAGLTIDHFVDDYELQDAALYRFVVLGEAVKRLSPEFRAAHTEITWSAIAGLRDLAAHAYDHIDIRQIWEIITVQVPALTAFVEPLAPPFVAPDDPPTGAPDA
jgi:uncharacterized protein with HEPN domain